MYNPLTGTNTGIQGTSNPFDWNTNTGIQGTSNPFDWNRGFNFTNPAPTLTASAPSIQEQAPVSWTSMIGPSVPYNYVMPNVMSFLTSPTNLFSNSQWANTPNNNLGAARFGGLLGSPINYTNPNTTTNTQGQ